MVKDHIAHAAGHGVQIKRGRNGSCTFTDGND
jgi:hypothetical protein